MTSATTSNPPSRELVASHSETRKAILDAAERLFAERGVEGTSVRDITREANVNLGAINYHFRTKDRLTLEVFIRAVEPVNQRRLAWLDRLEKEAAGSPLKIEAIMEALIRPLLENGVDGTRTSDAFRQLTSRCFQEANPEIKALVKERFGDLCRRMDEAILKALPHLSPDEVFWRTHFTIGAMHHTLGLWMRFDSVPVPGALNGQLPRRLDPEELIQQLIACSAAAFRAQVPGKTPSDR